MFSMTSDLDALTIHRDPQGELSGTIRIHTSDPAFPEFVVPVSDSLIIATTAYRPGHQLRPPKRQLPVRIALLPEWFLSYR
jgi:hypothetical protein